MRTGKLTAGGAGTALLISGALLIACGGDEGQSKEEADAPALASAAAITSDPYAIACAATSATRQRCGRGHAA